MRRALTLIALLLAPPAQAVTEQEAYEAYLACFAQASERLMPNWCHDVDKLAEFSHQSCLQETVAVSQTARVRSPQRARLNVEMDAKLQLYDAVRNYRAQGSCTR